MRRFVDDYTVFNDGQDGIRISVEAHPSFSDGRRLVYIEQNGHRNHVATFTTPEDGWLCRLIVHNAGLNGLVGFDAGPNNSLKVEVPA